MLGRCEELLKTVFPHLGGVLVEQVVAEGGLLRIVASTASTISASCPDCEVLSRRRHSGYERRLADDAVGGRRVSITLTIRRLFCDNPGCARVTFAEQVDGLTVRHGRRTPQLTGLARRGWTRSHAIVCAVPDVSVTCVVVTSGSLQVSGLRLGLRLRFGRAGLAGRLVVDQQAACRASTSSVLGLRRVGRRAERSETNEAIAWWVVA
jgi:hypothetical protein